MIFTGNRPIKILFSSRRS